MLTGDEGKLQRAMRNAKLLVGLKQVALYWLGAGDWPILVACHVSHEHFDDAQMFTRHATYST